ncbi:MAG: tetratricopeptide repeat protein [Paracoccaceae bacterium]
MKRRFCWLFPTLAVLGTPISAQSVTVQSGEHPAFSRLVVPLPPNASWSVRTNGKVTTIDLGLDTVEFDVSGVFNRIPKTRIAKLNQTAPGDPLSVSLSCDCEATTFVENGRHLVVDIGPKADTSPKDPVEHQQHHYRFADQGHVGARGMPISLGQIADAPTIQTEPKPVPQPLATDGVEPEDDLQFTQMLPEPETGEVLNASRLRLLEQIARAANQGLLTTKPEAKTDLKQQNKPSPSADASEVTLAATTAIDRDQSQIRFRNKDGTDAPNPACLPQSTFSLNTWNGEGSFQHQLGHLRAALYSEFDRVEDEAVVKLAKFYAFHGFGQEAVSVLQQVDEHSPKSALVLEIAQLVDAHPSHPLPHLLTQAECETDAAMWGLLARAEQGAPLKAEVADAALRGFSKLPVHLRRHLGPRLSHRFIQAGDPPRAASVLRAIDKSTDPSDGATQMAMAEVDLKRGKKDKAKAQLEQVVTEDSKQAPLALIRLVETSFQQGTPPGKPQSALAAAFAAEYRGTELGKQLEHAEILSLIMENRFGAAFSAIEESVAAGDPDYVVDAKSNVLHAMADRADDVTFLSLALQELERPQPKFNEHAGNAAADRFVQLGFADAASRLLQFPSYARKSEPRRVLRARIALHDRLPNRALVELAGLYDPAAEKLRAQALAMVGEFQSAADAFEVADDVDNVARAHWLNGAWNLVPDQSDERFSTAASLAEQLLSSAEISSGPLTAAEQLLETSSKTRAEIDQLLTTIANPSGPLN